MDPAFNAFNPRCPSRDVMDDVVGRWPALVLVSLLDNPHRFAQTARAVGGISDRMLSSTLARLVRRGLVLRTERQDRQHVEYALTEAGRVVAIALEGVVDAVYAVMPQLDLSAGQAAPV